MVDQGGRGGLFYRDYIQGKRVAINFIYTRCKASCSLSSVIFKSLQERTERTEIHLLTLTLDPDNDTSDLLQAHARKFNAQDRWHFLTGKAPSFLNLLKALGVEPGAVSTHSNMVLIGNARKQRWVRLYGMPSVEHIVNALDDVG